MNTIVFDEQTVVIPGWVTDHASFRRWAHSDDFPETGSVGFLQGSVWGDMSKEQIFSHNQVKHEFAFTLTGIIRAHRVPIFASPPPFTRESVLRKPVLRL